jgi:hypothetical protein
MERRAFLKGTLAGGVAFGLGFGPEGCGPRAQRRKVFSDDEAATLDAVAAGIVTPLDARELRIVDKIDSLLAGADDVTQRDLKRLLWVFGTPLGALLHGRLASFGELAPDAQDAVLISWRDSRLPFERSGFQAMQRLCLAVAYATPAVYPSIGYPGPPFLVRPDGTTVGGMPSP